MQNLKSCRDSFGETLVELGESNPDIVVLTADLADSTRVMEFGKKFPERFFNIGVAEQNLAGLAAGFAAESFIPIITSYAVFSPGRNWEQIRDSICYSNLHVIIIGAHAGLSASVYGATHTGLEDLALMRVLPNMTVISPADANQTSSAFRAAIEHSGPIYIRFSRQQTPIIYPPENKFEIGSADILKEGTDITLIAAGSMVSEALGVAETLQNTQKTQMISPSAGGSDNLTVRESESPSIPSFLNSPVSVEVINISTIKPLDIKTIINSAKKTGRVITVEDHQITGGLGSAVAEVLSEYYPVPIKRLGMLDSFGESGNPADLYQKFGLTKECIAKEVMEMLK